MNRHSGSVFSIAAAGAVLAVSAATTPAEAAEPFKQTNIHFETNASGCDMGIQMSFDTDGLTVGRVRDPNGQIVFQFGAHGGMGVTHDVTEGFQERVEPQITDLIDALGCERDDEEPEIFLTELLSAWPEGRYIFLGHNEEDSFRGFAELSHRVPAGPEILAPEDGEIVSSRKNLLIQWQAVTEPIMPELGPVDVVGYHVVIADVTRPEPLPPGQTTPQFDVDVAKWAESVWVPKQFLRPNRIYEFEVLATERGGNQTITEGGTFCTPPIAEEDCEAP